MTAEGLHQIRSASLFKIKEWLDERKNININDKEIFTLKEKEVINKVEKNLRLTESMHYEFIEFMKYHKLKNKSIEDIILKYYNIEIKDKREGKISFERIRKEIIEL